MIEVQVVIGKWLYMPVGIHSWPAAASHIIHLCAYRIEDQVIILS